MRLGLNRTGCRWMWDPYSHRAVLVHLDDLDDLLAVLEVDGLHVELLGRNGRPVAVGGLLGGAA